MRLIVALAGYMLLALGALANTHIDAGNTLLASGDYNGALDEYNRAVDTEPNNYMVRYKRATVLLALRRTKQAVQDLDAVVNLKPDFNQAWLQRGKLLLQVGRFDAAEHDYRHVLSISSENAQAKEGLSQVHRCRELIDMGKAAQGVAQFHEAIEHYRAAGEIAPMFDDLRLWRADCYLAINDVDSALADIERAAKLQSDPTKALFHLSKLHYERTGNLEDCLKHVRECLKHDPDEPNCHPLYKKAKKLAKQLSTADERLARGEHERAIESLRAARATEPHVAIYHQRIAHKLCSAYVKWGKGTEAVRECDEAVRLVPGSADVLCDRAEARLLVEDFDGAVQDFSEANRIHPDQRVQEGLQRAQRLQKQSKARNYYKILGVQRTATKKDIMKAYRKLAVEWHPDKFQDEGEKKAAEKRFIDLAAAKEVLTDDEKRRQYDAGEDPLDPTSQQQQGFHHGGFNPFHGGHGGHGGGFKFHFNF
eukprot:Colp12_sorted_trinity150504_noHs@28745